MRAVMALAAHVVRAAPRRDHRRGHAGGGHAPSGACSSAISARRTVAVSAPLLQVATSTSTTATRRRSAASRSTSPAGEIVAIVGANGAGKTLADPHHRRHRSAARAADRASTAREIAGWPSHRVCEPRHRPGGRRPPGVPEPHGAREPRDGRHAAARPRRARRRTLERVYALFPAARRAARARRPARSPAASSRCSPSAAA